MKRKAARQPKLKCCLCGALIHDRRLACSALPLKDGRCCPKCDDMKVMPARLIQRGVPQQEAKVIGKNIHAAVKFARRRWLQIQ